MIIIVLLLGLIFYDIDDLKHTIVDCLNILTKVDDFVKH